MQLLFFLQTTQTTNLANVTCVRESYFVLVRCISFRLGIIFVRCHNVRCRILVSGVKSVFALNLISCFDRNYFEPYFILITSVANVVSVSKGFVEVDGIYCLDR